MHLPALIDFLAGLEENNNKAWFVMNRPSYDILRSEFIAFVGEVIEAVGRFDPAVADLDPRRALFRINRDLRFSNDKRPYKTHFSAALAATGRKAEAPMYYFHIDAQGELLLGAGCYHPPPPALARIRAAQAADPRGFTRLIRRPTLVRSFGGLDESEMLARPPKGYAPDDPAVRYLRNRNCIVSRSQSVRRRQAKGLPAEIAGHFRAAHPLVAWLRELLPESGTLDP